MSDCDLLRYSHPDERMISRFDEKCVGDEEIRYVERQECHIDVCAPVESHHVKRLALLARKLGLEWHGSIQHA